jgi:hypothetical protein
LHLLSKENKERLQRIELRKQESELLAKAELEQIH